MEGIIQGSSGEIVFYSTEDGHTAIDVRREDDTIGLSLNQMRTLFRRDNSFVSSQLNGVLKVGELSKKSVVAKNATAQIEGTRKVVHEVGFYNLDVVLSVGYRVNSKRDTDFRIWATQILRDLF